MNTKIDDGSDIAELMKIYKEQTIYDYDKFPHTSKRKHQFIVDEGGEKEMCEIVENYAKEVAKEENMVIAKRLFQNGVPYETVQQCIGKLTEDELNNIMNELSDKV